MSDLASSRAGGARTLFHGWKILFVVFTTQGVATAFTVYGFGFFSVPIEQEFGVGRSTVAWGLTANMLLVALISPWIGRQLDRRRIRTFMLIGGVCLSVTLGIVAISPSLLLSGIAYAIGSSIMTACLGPLAASKLLASWFYTLRARVLGISAIGTSVAGFLAPPLLQLAIESWGWRSAAGVSAVAAAVLTLPWIALLIHNRPADLDLFPDGAAADPPAAAGGAVSWDSAALMRDRNFWIITFAAGSIMATIGALVPSLRGYFDSIGLDGKSAALLFPVLSTGGIIGKLTFAAVGDRFAKRTLLLLTQSFIAGFLLLLIAQPSIPVLVVGSFVIGLALGGVMPLWSALLAETYGAESFGQVMGAMSPAMLPLNLFCLQFLPWCFERYGSYTPALRILLAILGVAALTTGFLRRQGAPTPGRGN